MTEKAKELLGFPFNKLEANGIDYLIKIREDKAIAIVPKLNKYNNIATIRVRRQYIKIEIFRISNEAYNCLEDFNDSLINEMRECINLRVF
jgi:hypothetical protein